MFEIICYKKMPLIFSRTSRRPWTPSQAGNPGLRRPPVPTVTPAAMDSPGALNNKVLPGSQPLCQGCQLMSMPAPQQPQVQEYLRRVGSKSCSEKNRIHLMFRSVVFLFLIDKSKLWWTKYPPCVSFPKSYEYDWLGIGSVYIIV